MPPAPGADLLSFVRRGQLDLERFVEVMTTRGYILDTGTEPGCSLGSTAIEAARQDHLDALLALMFAGDRPDIALDRAATDKGGESGAYLYALFNQRIVDREHMLRILERENRRSGAEPLS